MGESACSWSAIHLHTNLFFKNFFATSKRTGQVGLLRQWLPAGLVISDNRKTRVMIGLIKANILSCFVVDPALWDTALRSGEPITRFLLVVFFKKYYKPFICIMTFAFFFVHVCVCVCLFSKKSATFDVRQLGNPLFSVSVEDVTVRVINQRIPSLLTHRY